MKKVFFLVGPTAIGKTEVAIKLARKIKAEIISCDSMQVYREMDIISAKPSKSQRKNLPHYLIDQVSVTRKFSVADYQKKALEAIKKIHKKEKIALVVGGSGLYMQVLLDGIFNQGKGDISIRRFLYRQAKKYGNLYLYERLRRVDAQAAFKIHPNDLRRIIRALEVFDATGMTISKHQKKRRGGIWGRYDVRIFGLICNRDELYRSIDLRTQKMFKKGLVKEARNLINKKLSQTASQGIGIKEIKGCLEGRYGLDEAKRKMKLNSRHFAKRQLIWFRKEKRINWVKISKKDTPTMIANRLVGLLK